MKVIYRGLILATLPLLVEVIFIASIFGVLNLAEKEREIERIHRHQTSLSAHSFGQSALLPFLLVIGMYTKSHKYLETFDKIIVEVDATVRETDEYYHKHQDLFPPEDAEKVKQIFDLFLRTLREGRKFASESMGLSFDDTIDQLTDQFNRAQGIVAFDMASLLKKGDQATLALQERFQRTLAIEYGILASGILLNIAVAIGLWIFFKKTFLDRIGVIAKNTQAITGKAWLIPEMGGNDEIGQLDHAFHQMAKKLIKASEIEKSLFNNASDVIAVLDENNKFLRINPAGERDWKYPIERLQFTSIDQLIVPAERAIFMENLVQTKNNDAPSTFEAAIVNRHGECIDGLWSIYWSAETRNLFFIFHDITEQKAIEQERKNFLAVISQDLQKPLLQIGKSVQDLVTGIVGGLPPASVEKLSLAERNLKRLNTLVRDLVQVTEMESGKLELNLKSVSAAQLNERALSEIQILADKKKLQLQNRSCSNDVSVYADEDKILQVLVNLLSNAVKFTDTNGTILITAQPIDSGWVRFAVQDSGRGIPASQLDAVFKKFQQVEVGDAKRKAGTGLGLPICKQLVEEHGGQIGVVSTDGVGSTFWFTLPSTRSLYEKKKSSMQGADDEALFKRPSRTTRLKLKTKDAKSAEAPPARKKNSGLPLTVQGLILIGLPLIFELMLTGGLAKTLIDVHQERTREIQMRNIAFLASDALRVLLEFSSTWVKSPRIRALTNSADDYKRSWDNSLARLTDTISGDERFSAAMEKVNKAASRLRNFEQSNGTEQALEGVANLVSIIKNLNTIMATAEDKERTDPAIERRAREEQKRMLALGLAANLGASLFLGIFFALNVSKRLMIMSDNARRLANEETLNDPVGGGDEIAELDASFHDAAEMLLDTRKRERAVFDNSKDVLGIVAKDGKFTNLNPAAEKAWGFKPDDLLKRGISAVVHPQDLQKLNDVIGGSASATIEETIEVRIVTADGNIRWTLWTVSRPKGNPSSFCVVRDNTDRKQLDQLRKDFLAVVSHDLRTPLTGVLGIANLISANAFGPVAEPAKGQLKGIERHCDSLLELTNDILDLEKLEAGEMKLARRPMTIPELFTALQNMSNDNRIPLQMKIVGEENARPLECDAERLTQAITSLIKYLAFRTANSDQQGPLAHQSNTTSLEKRNAIRVIANYLGPGIEFRIFDNAGEIQAEIRQRLFERTKDPALKESFNDEMFRAELAMPLAAKIITSHGGTVQIESQNNSNCFVVRIPYAAVTAETPRL